MSKSHKDFPELPPEVNPAPAGEAKPAKFETPAPVDPGGPVPRTIKPIERATEGFKRYKIVCRSRAESRVLYILAKSEDEARKHYLKECGLANLKEEPLLSVTVLPD